MEISTWCGYRPLAAAFSSSYFSAKPSSSLPLSLASSGSAFFASCGGGTRATRGPTGQSLVSVVPRRRRRRTSTTTHCLFGLGVPELVVIAGVAALVFGPKQLPEVGRTIGKSIKSFQQAAKEFETELKKEPEDKSDESPPTEIPKTVGSGDEKKELEPSGTKDSV
ncbi:sec-independent protein translocase protein TATA, chloroplastic-like [Iris pallida]|uniref:Sec-independent protein translocase protein TATA, chloroplastic-like n=1 Tax=Iris pallida TaxID=29817 RepID=A0AAX6E1F6_IRIPA|nr:sec-independent protein translocase protein TATA, chloroplastic-like [Iris pallida]KAJ6841832.1 sec-independent protein translocase protein TATA, chloroplastic-like [Iris pallida]